jgi:alpha-tubulin suppressor-like RCC1 family protein
MDCMVCNNACQLVPGSVTGFCGDGVTQSAQGEECDQPTAPCAYGQMSCMTCDAQCKRTPGEVTGFCGDGQVQGAQEQCDAPTMPCPYGQMSCMTCRNCQNTPGQVTGYCGDGQVQAGSGEECDGAATMACPAGTIGDTTCLATCKFTAACSKPVAAGSGFYHSCAIFQNGTMRCWGSSDGNPGGLRPSLVAGAVTVKQMVGGNSHTCFLLANETVRCLGEGYYGQLGTGGTGDRTTPATVIGVTGAKQLTAGENFTCALLSNGTVKCWGDGYQGQLGDGQSSPSSTPVVVAGLSNVTSIAAGFSHACATRTDGSVRCWGSGYEGQLGDGRSTSADVIVAVSSITNAKAVAAHQNQTCALLTTGQVRCWGWNGWGQLGDGSQNNRPSPAPAISGLSGVEQVVMGGFHTCARLTSGAVKCWGGGDVGQLGDGTTTYNRSIPGAAVSGISAAVDITAGRAHTCAVLQTGETRCWGTNSGYQLGTMMFVQYSATPLPVEF